MVISPPRRPCKVMADFGQPAALRKPPASATLAQFMPLVSEYRPPARTEELPSRPPQPTFPGYRGNCRKPRPSPAGLPGFRVKAWMTPPRRQRHKGNSRTVAHRPLPINSGGRNRQGDAGGCRTQTDTVQKQDGPGASGIAQKDTGGLAKAAIGHHVHARLCPRSRTLVGCCRSISSCSITVTDDRLSPTVSGPSVAVTTTDQGPYSSEDWAATARGQCSDGHTGHHDRKRKLQHRAFPANRAPARESGFGCGKGRGQAETDWGWSRAGIRPPKPPTATPGVFPGRSPGLQEPLAVPGQSPFPMPEAHGAFDCRFPAYRCGAASELHWRTRLTDFRFTRRASRRTPEKVARLATSAKWLLPEIRQLSGSSKKWPDVMSVTLLATCYKPSRLVRGPGADNHFKQ